MMVILRREWLWLVFCLAMVVFVVYMNEGHTYPPIALQELEQAEEENTVETAAESIPLLPQPELTVMAAEDYFLEYRLKRERARGQQAEMLWEIVQNPNTDADSRREAQEALLQISSTLEKEVELEGLLTAKGFTDAVVFIRPQQVYVVVKAMELELEQVSQIGDAIAGLCAVSLEDIVIDYHP